MLIKSLESSFGYRMPRTTRPISPQLFPELAQTHLFVVMLVQHLCCCQVKVLLGDVYSPLSKRIHSRFGTHSLQLGSRTAIHLLRNLGEIDTSCEVHAPAVDAKDIGTGLYTVDNVRITD